MAASLTSLLARASIDDHSEALSVADAAIASSKTDVTAQHTKVVALLRLDRYDDALRVIAAAGSAVEDRCILEKTYALYKTGSLDEAASLLEGRDMSDAQRPLKHVAAQIAYRTERFSQASELYSLLMEDDHTAVYGEDTDLIINQLATYAQLEWQGRGDLVPDKSKQPRREDMEAFETAYNAGCGCVARGDLAKASILLKRASDLCDAAEDLSEDEKKTEMLPIILQQAYVFALLGKTEEAAALQRDIESYETSDRSIKAAAGWNSLISKSVTNQYMIQRLSELVPEAKIGNDRLFNHQAVGVSRNQYAIALQCYKHKEVNDKTAGLLKGDGVPSTDLERVYAGYFNAAAKAKSQTDKEALKTTLAVLEKRPYDVGLLLTIIHFYIQAKNYDSAIDVLQKFFKYVESAGTADHEDVRYAPGLVALAVALYRTQNRRKDIRDELGRAAAYWQKIPKNSSTTLLREAGIELLHSSKPSDLATAGAAFERMVDQDSEDRIAQAGLVASFATTDYSKVEPYLSELSSVEELTSGIDVSALLDAGVPAFPAPQQPSKKRKANEVEAGTGVQLSSNKQKKKPRLGKNYDPNVKPDPERWLPMRDRSYYKPKGRKGKKRAAESTQGGAVANEAETLNLAGGAGQIKVEKAPQGSGGGGKKGKKGRKG
ncbi:Signal recognition particle subunit SRP72 [Diaporthe australafricana]|uniref:Signal recognition particle subunit SRP72 n=1 Tax=Diaporthe australafricana TaxID=127596 RepID=A0ABR3W2D6_9PEZI